MVKKTCEICSKVFERRESYFNHRPARFCSATCRNSYFSSMKSVSKCKNCSVKVYGRKGYKRRYCGQKCYWQHLKSSYQERSTGKYKTIIVNGKRIREHRHIASIILGRKLKEGEIVHHKNHDRSDNRPQNLEVIMQSDHIKRHLH